MSLAQEAEAVQAAPSPRRMWSAGDVAIMREHWAALGTVRIQPMLSVWRSESCIQGKAKRMGLSRAGKRAPYQRYAQSDLVDHQIRTAYATGKPGEVKALSARLGRGSGWIRWRAMQLGCRPVRVKEPDWSSREEAILERMEGKGVIALRNALRKAGYTRGLKAIYQRLHKRGLDLHESGYMTLPTIAHAMGIDAKCLDRWVRVLELRTVTRRNHEGEMMHIRWVTRAELRRFILDNLLYVDIRKADKFWLVDLLVGTR